MLHRGTDVPKQLILWRLGIQQYLAWIEHNRDETNNVLEGPYHAKREHPSRPVQFKKSETVNIRLN